MRKLLFIQLLCFTIVLKLHRGLIGRLFFLCSKCFSSSRHLPPSSPPDSKHMDSPLRAASTAGGCLSFTPLGGGGADCRRSPALTTSTPSPSTQAISSRAARHPRPSSWTRTTCRWSPPSTAGSPSWSCDDSSRSAPPSAGGSRCGTSTASRIARMRCLRWVPSSWFRFVFFGSFDIILFEFLFFGCRLGRPSCAQFCWSLARYDSYPSSSNALLHASLSCLLNVLQLTTNSIIFEISVSTY